jgi:uncharacterized protein YrzB (UPF0473 family)
MSLFDVFEKIWYHIPRNAGGETSMEEKRETLRITDENGVEKDIEVLSYFTLDSNGKDYLIYTQDQEDANGNVLAYTAEVIEHDDAFELKGIDDQTVLEEIREIMLETINAGD